ncbi:MAG: hypothetical protein SH856_05530 [Flavobacteriales bacterium]|nr:hypothetical protein [Flavobacteriales bacterium]
MDASSTPYDSSFPTANVAYDQNPIYAYVKSDSDGYSNCGVFDGVTTVYYDDEEDLLHYPFSYGDSFTDNLHSNFTSGIDFERSGSITVEADAWGNGVR